jgi:hypothetical protein
VTTFDGAIVREPGVTFGLAVVKSHVLNSQAEANALIVSYQRIMNVAPVVLMSQDNGAAPIYYGRKDLVTFLDNFDMTRLRWRKYTFRT